MEQGELINGLKTKMWIERYIDLGEFTFTADADDRIQNILPIGTLISHVNSSEIMVVENHEIREDVGKETEVKITGRSFESALENRIVGSNKAWPTVATAEDDYTLAPALVWNQAVTLIQDHIGSAFVIDPDDALMHVQILTDVVGTSEEIERILKRGDVYSRLIELLTIEGLGIKTARPGVRSPLGFASPNMAIVIHRGEDLTAEVAFSYATGEIQSADYLWSVKKLKNAALITGRFIETVIKDASEGYARRWMYVDASDIDGDYSVEPTGSDRTDVLAAMTIRGQEALAAQNSLALVKTEPTKDSRVYRYREHYGVGDIITVDGQYSQTAPMRISEFVETEDENGESGYPTLSAV